MLHSKAEAEAWLKVSRKAKELAEACRTLAEQARSQEEKWRETREYIARGKIKKEGNSGNHNQGNQGSKGISQIKV